MRTQLPNTYLNENQLPFLFCPGCGHGAILNYLNQALIKLALDPQKVVIVTDIGCAGLSDRYFVTHAFHGLHGRSITYGTGINLADPDLIVIVLIGDGGCGIGGHHLLNAARRNIGVTTLVFNNLNYGMTGGEHSVTTPSGGITATTHYGQIEHPLDICSTVGVNGASFVARTTTFDKNIPNLIAQAIQNQGFSLIDIWELCTAHYVPNNRFSKAALEDTLKNLGFATGILVNKPRPPYQEAYTTAHQEILGRPAMAAKPIQTKYEHQMTSSLGIIIAGAAGTKIGSAASTFGVGALLSGLWATQRDDYPVTVKSGHSIAEIILSPDEIRYTGISKPDMVIALFPEGLAKSRHYIQSLTPSDTLVISDDLPEVDTLARKLVIDFKSGGKWGQKKEYRAIIALALVLKEFDYYPLDAFEEAISIRPKYAQDNLASVKETEHLDFRVR